MVALGTLLIGAFFAAILVSEQSKLMLKDRVAVAPLGLVEESRKRVGAVPSWFKLLAVGAILGTREGTA